MKQMKWEIENCSRPITECVSCQDARALIELSQQYLDGDLVEKKEVTQINPEDMDNIKLYGYSVDEIKKIIDFAKSRGY